MLQEDLYVRPTLLSGKSWNQVEGQRMGVASKAHGALNLCRWRTFINLPEDDHSDPSQIL